MRIDFTPLINKEMGPLEFYSRFTIDDLRAATNTSLDTIYDIIKDTTDEEVVFNPDDPDADDPHAPPELRYIGWSLAHLVLHVTASAEESAAFSSLLARGVTLPAGTRLRYEPDWQTTYRTKKEVVQRLEESRRIRLSYLDTWPDKPHVEVFRTFAEDSPAYNQINCIGAFAGGLRHETNHHEQMRKVLLQARAAVK